MKNQSSFYLPRVELRVQQTGDTRTAVGLLPYDSVTDMGGWLEIIRPGAFASALEPGVDLLALRDHKPELLLGRSKSGTLRTVELRLKHIRLDNQMSLPPFHVGTA